MFSDASSNVGTGDVSFNGGYILNTTQYVLPPAVTGNGCSFSGWFYPTGTEPANTAIFDISCAAPTGTGNIAVYCTANAHFLGFLLYFEEMVKYYFLFEVFFCSYELP
jgi:hypothetical protein